MFGENKRPLYLDNNGLLQEADADWLKPNGQPAILQRSPVGWQDNLVKYARNLKYWGVFRDMTVPLDFPGDGGEILNQLRWSKGVEAVAYLGISRLHPTELPYVYKNWYFCELNFSKYRRGKTSTKIEALEGGMSKVLKAFEDTEYEIPIDTDPDHINVLFDGVTLRGSYTWTFGNLLYSSDEGNGGGKDWVIGAAQLGQEGKAFGITYEDCFAELMQADGDDPAFFNYIGTSDNIIARASQDNAGNIDVRFKGTIKLELTTKRDTCFVRLRLLKVKQPWNPPSGPDNPHYYPIFAPGEGIGTNFTTQGEVKDMPFDITVTMAPGEVLFTYLEVIATGSEDTSDFTILDGEMNSEFFSKFKPTYVKGFHAWDLLKKIVANMVKDQNLAAITDNVFVKSTWLENKLDCFITSGDAIRGIETTETQRGAVIKTSFSSFFKSMTGVFGAGVGIESERLVMELFNYFFKNNVIADLGEVDEAEDWYADDLGFNTIIAGGPEVDYEDVNGKLETHQQSNWATPVTRVIRELDLTTVYRRDPIGMELLRIERAGQSTTDDKSDNDPFMVNIKPQELEDVDLDITYHELNRPAYSQVLGVLDPVGIFNLEYSPLRSLLNNGSFVASVLELMEDKYIRFTKQSKNRDLKTTGGPFVGTVDEDADILIGSSGSKTFRPEYIKFVAKVPIELQDQMDSDPYGKVRFKVRGRQFHIYLNDGGIKPAIRDKYTFVGISVPENDMKNFNKPI